MKDNLWGGNAGDFWTGGKMVLLESETSRRTEEVTVEERFQRFLIEISPALPDFVLTHKPRLLSFPGLIMGQIHSVPRLPRVAN